LQQESRTSLALGDVLLAGFCRKRVQRKSPKQTPVFCFVLFCFYGKIIIFGKSGKILILSKFSFFNKMHK